MEYVAPKVKLNLNFKHIKFKSKTVEAWAGANNNNKKVIFKSYSPFTDCISEIHNTKVDNAKDIDVIMPINNLIECSNNY